MTEATIMPSQTNAGSDLAVFDLDGTLISGNSMKKFALWLFLRLIRATRWGGAFRVGVAVMVRKLKFSSHREMKWKLLRIASRWLAAKDYEEFVEERLIPCLRPQVVELLKSSRSRGCISVLATAAPDVYAAILGKKLHFAHTVATPFSPRLPLRSFTECRGKMKLKVVSSLGLTRLFATDHADDLPLMLACTRAGGTNYLVAPSPLTLMTVRAAGIPFTPIGS